MPYKLRKAPKKDLYWVVNKETGKKYSKEPLPKGRAQAQMRALYANENVEGAGLLGDIFGKIKTVAQRAFTPSRTEPFQTQMSVGPAMESKTDPALFGVDVGMPTTDILQRMVKVAYDGGVVNGWNIMKRTPTLTFFQRGNTVVIAVRGTYDKRDARADLAIPLDNLENTDRFKDDLATVQAFEKEYGPQYQYYATGHSLGGAIIDKLLQLQLVKRAISFNPAIEPSDYQKGDRHRRIYIESDPLYKLMGKNAVGTEIRPSKKSIFRGIPGVGDFLDTVLSHSIDNFVGGKVENAMIQMPKPDYYAEHRRIIDLLNETSKKLKAEANDQSAEVRKQRKGGSSHLVCGGRRMRGFIVAGDSDSESDMEGGAEPPMPMPEPMGVPFDMVRLTEPALPSYNRVSMSGGRDETPEERRQRLEREAADRNRNEQAQPARALTPPRRPAQQPAQPPPPPQRERVQPPAPRGMNNPNIGRRLNFEGQGQTFAKMTEAMVGMSKEELKDLKKKAKGRKTREQLMAELEEAKKKLAEAPQPSKTALDRLMEGGGDDEEMEELVELMKEKMAAPITERPESKPVEIPVMAKKAQKKPAPKPAPKKKSVAKKPSLPTVMEDDEMEGGAKMTLPMLKAKAKAMGLKGFSKMKKAQLMEALKGGAKEKPKEELKDLLAEYMGTLSLGQPSPKAPAKGRGRLQRRTPKTRRLSVKDKKER